MTCYFISPSFTNEYSVYDMMNSDRDLICCFRKSDLWPLIFVGCSVVMLVIGCRDWSVPALSQWETMLHCKVSHWLGTCTKWSLRLHIVITHRRFRDITPLLMHCSYVSFALGLWYYRADSSFALSQWETLLQSNTISHWLGANLASALYYQLCSCFQCI